MFHLGWEDTYGASSTGQWLRVLRMFGTKVPVTDRSDPGFLSYSSMALKPLDRILCGH